MIILDVEQGTQEWHKARAGVITASRAGDFSQPSKLATLPSDIVFTKDGKEHVAIYDGVEFRNTSKLNLDKSIRESLPRIYPESREGYLCELVGEVITDCVIDDLPFKQLEWGKKHEEAARIALEDEIYEFIDEVGFIYKDESRRAGVSPDGLIRDKEIGVELKCPFTTKVFVDFVCNNKVKQEYVEQCQYSMWNTGYKFWYFASYDPRITMGGKNIHYVLIERDELYMEKYDAAYKVFIAEMDERLKKMGVDLIKHK